MSTRPLTEAGRTAAEAADTEALRAALIAANGCVAEARRKLGWAHRTTYKRLESLGLTAWLEETYPNRRATSQARRRERERALAPPWCDACDAPSRGDCTRFWTENDSPECSCRCHADARTEPSAVGHPGPSADFPPVIPPS